MKKLILIAAVALFSLGVSAQKYNAPKLATPLNVSPEDAQARQVREALLNGNGKSVSNAATRALTRVVEPEGTPNDYFLVRSELVDWLGFLPERLTKETVYLSADGTKIYLPNMVWPSQFGSTPNYVEGTVNGNVISIPAGQVVGTMQMNGVTYEFYLAAVDIQKTNLTKKITPSYDPIQLYFDSSVGLITWYNSTGTQYNGAYIGLFYDYTSGGYTYTNNAAYVASPSYFSHTFYADPVTRQMTYRDAYTGESGSAAVEHHITNLGLHFMKGILPDYSDVYVLFKDAYEEYDPKTGEGIGDPIGIMTGVQVISDNRVMFASDGTPSWNQTNMRNYSCPFIYDSTTDTYTQLATPTRRLRDLWQETVENEGGSTSEKYIYSHDYCDMIIGKAAGSGISGVETSTDKEAVSTEYYDLSGRRISAADKGVSIKVEKYADGTSKAVKVLK